MSDADLAAVPRLGVTLTYATKALTAAREKLGGREPKTFEVLQQFVLPLTAERRCSLVELLWAQFDARIKAADAAKKKLFESMANERDAMNAQDISALAAQRREKFQEDLVSMLLDKGSDVDGGGVRVLLKFHGSEYYGAGRQTMTHGFKGAAKALLDLGVARGDTAREVAAELEAAVDRGDLTYVNGSHPVSSTTVVEARYEASPELYAACAEKRAAEDDLRRSAADAERRRSPATSRSSCWATRAATSR